PSCSFPLHLSPLRARPGDFSTRLGPDPLERPARPARPVLLRPRGPLMLASPPATALARPAPTCLDELTDASVVCPCRGTTRGEVAASVCDGHASLGALGHATGAGTEPGCTACHAALGGLIALHSPRGPGNLASPKVRQNQVEVAKAGKDGLDCLDDVRRAAASDDWQGLSEADKHRFKWHGLFFPKQTPRHFMLRLPA